MSIYKEVIENQRAFFNSGVTRSIQFRLQQLNILKNMISMHEQEIVAAIHADLGKPAAEAVITEILVVQNDINFLIKNLKKLTKDECVRTPLVLQPGSSRIVHEPYGCVLIIGAWNYPFQLLISPLIGAISAGNCVILKPSEVAHTSEALIARLIKKYFSENFISVICADAHNTDQLLQEHFDYIFYTGNPKVGKLVMQAAAQHLTPVTLELGGKSPCIVTANCDLKYAARRIAWGKWTNAGQTCIAPDYLYIEHTCKNEFIQHLTTALKEFYGNDPAQSSSYSRIINDKHFLRLISLLNNDKIIFGGEHNAEQKYIAPTLLDHVSWQDPIMQDEIFGPLLPIMTFEHIDEVINSVNQHPKPLALYLFTQDKHIEQRVFNEISFGGGCLNDCLLQAANPHLPFGGVGASGMGAYHGTHSFETFSHRKSIYKKRWQIDFKLEYPPYSEGKLNWIRKLFSL